MEEKQENLKVRWHKNDIIRHKITGHPLLVLHIYKNICTIVVDLESTEPLSQTYALLPKCYNYYAHDSEMKCEEEETKVSNWHFERYGDTDWNTQPLAHA
jgi:hypothetical protein